jgi:nitrogen fixation NifU-like protein
MSDTDTFAGQDPAVVRELLSGSGYSDKAIEYYLRRPNMGSLPDADQVSELTGPCGDTMKVYLKVNHGRVEDAKIQVLGCPGAIASAMVAMDLIKGQPVREALKLKDRDIFRVLEAVPDQKQHCIRLAVKTVVKGLQEYINNNGNAAKEDKRAAI